MHSDQLGAIIEKEKQPTMSKYILMLTLLCGLFMISCSTDTQPTPEQQQQDDGNRDPGGGAGGGNAQDPFCLNNSGDDYNIVVTLNDFFYAPSYKIYILIMIKI